MKSFIKFFVCGIFCFSLSSAHSQQGTMSTTALIFPDSSCVGYSDSVYVTMKNIDTASYSGSIFFWIGTAQTNFTPIQFCFIQQITLQPNDSVQQGCVINFDSTNFTGGNNIVVVWSSGNNKAQADSIQDLVYLCGTGAGIHENKLSPSFTIYPTLAKDFITIESPENVLPKKIFIEDVTGRIIGIVTPSQESKIRIKLNVADLNSGIYFLDILLPNKQRVVSKFVKTD
ncbi:MAG: T9SS type A sorting domain-containing protein [Bacteroidetes bacterium]|nr:T9SS type A sorting domain-containing protein [Bacteroidota bacterium]